MRKTITVTYEENCDKHQKAERLAHILTDGMLIYFKKKGHFKTAPKTAKKTDHILENTRELSDQSDEGI